MLFTETPRSPAIESIKLNVSVQNMSMVLSINSQDGQWDLSYYKVTVHDEAGKILGSQEIPETAKNYEIPKYEGMNSMRIVIVTQCNQTSSPKVIAINEIFIMAELPEMSTTSRGAWINSMNLVIYLLVMIVATLI